MKKTNLFLTIITPVLFFLYIFVFIQPVQADSAFQKGICYATWQKDRYLSAYSDKALEGLAQTGAEWVSIITTYYQEKFNSQKIYSTQKTPSDKSIIHVISQAHKLGLKVMLKPHVDLIDRSDRLWRGDIGFQNQADWRGWFSQYLKFILHYARLAEKADVELFCIGTELCFASAQTEFWQNYIIPRIRKVYKGELIYAANWDEYKDIHFWNGLDYAGIDAYFPLTQNRNPGYDEIKASWEKWIEEIDSWQKQIDKPVIFTEIGYRSCELAAAKPWEYASSQRVNLEIQADCYEAALSTVYNQPWCYGIYWWYWRASPYAGGLNNRDFTPQDKPAEMTLSYWYNAPTLAQLSQ